MFLRVAAVLLCVGVGLSSAGPREKRYAGSYAGAGFPFGPFAGGYAGAAAGAGWPGAFGFGPFGPFGGYDYPRPVMPFPFFPMPKFEWPKNWYEGDNVCKEVRYSDVKEPEFGDFLSDSDFNFGGGTYNSQNEHCKGNNDKYVCIKRSTDQTGQIKLQATKYQCCYGFVRDPTGAPGCVEINLKDTLPTLRSVNALQFAHMIEQASMAETLYSGNFTIFTPPNAVLDAFLEDHIEDDTNEIVIKAKNRRLKEKIKLHKMLSNHMTTGFHGLNDLKNDQLLFTENSQIRINIFYIPQKVVTVNCVPIVRGDHFARNGIIHEVEKILPIPTRTVADIIAGDNQFSILKGMLSRAGMVQTLRSPNKTFTIFAPTDSAFPQNYPEKRCAQSLIKHHVIGHAVCSSAIPQYARSMNLLGELISLSRNEHNKLYVDDVQIVVRDMVATNGVVHVIDGVLTSRQAKTVSHVLAEYGLTEFLKLLEKANLISLYDSMENVTYFIPSNEAIQAVPTGLMTSLFSNLDTLFSLLLYHVTNDFQALQKPEEILNSKLENMTIRVQTRTPHIHAATQMIVQCAMVLSLGNKICGGTIHVINKILLPPKLSIIEYLESLEGFASLILLLKVTGLDRRLNNSEFVHTILAPTDDAFHQMSEVTIFRLLEDLHLARDLLRMHLLSGAVCCSQFKNSLVSGRPYTRAIDGSLLWLEPQRPDSVKIGGSNIVDCDIMASNGIIHMVDAVVRQQDVALRTGGYTNNEFIRI